MNSLADAHQVQLYIDRKALAEAGVGADTPLTCSVKRLNFKTELTLLLDELDLTYLVRNEVLLITTKTAAENLLTTKVYPVFDLVVRPPDAPATRPDLDFQSLINNITTNIAAETWDEVGGPGTIQPFTNSAALVISQTTGCTKRSSSICGRCVRLAPPRSSSTQTRTDKSTVRICRRRFGTRLP